MYPISHPPPLSAPLRSPNHPPVPQVPRSPALTCGPPGFTTLAAAVAAAKRSHASAQVVHVRVEHREGGDASDAVLSHGGGDVGDSVGDAVLSHGGGGVGDSAGDSDSILSHDTESLSPTPPPLPV